MMEEENKNQQANRLRNIAASTIQCWWRYHLATNWKPPRRYAYFTHVCYKLYITEERINQNRELAKKLRDKLERRRPIKKKSFNHQASVTAEILKFGLKGIVKPVLEKQDSLEKVERKASLRRTRSEDRRSSLPDALAMVDPTIRKRVLFAGARNSSVETSMSSSVDVSELETQFEIKNFLEQNVDELSSKEVDISLLIKYRPLLRFYYFVMFRFLMNKFHNQRIAGQLLMIEAEIAERENQRNQKMKELEAVILELTGNPMISPFDPSRQKRPILERIELAEQHLDELERKFDYVNDLALKCLNAEMLRAQQETKLARMEAREKEREEQGLPPKHPGKKPMGMKRQVTVVEQSGTGTGTADDCETISLDGLS
uniref:Uncharacterized protein n=1 Tax=Caenorhabditis japonica TaxID=281687 RepID=A0A8R1I1W9_CAEJA